MTETARNVPRLYSIQQFAEKHPAFSESMLRWLRFNCESNGFRDAFVNVGRRVLIDEVQFFATIAAQNQNSSAPDAA